MKVFSNQLRFSDDNLCLRQHWNNTEYLNAHCRAIFMSDLDSCNSIDAKNGLKHLDWTPDTRDTECVLKWVLVPIAAFCCAHWPQLLIPELEYYRKVSSCAEIWPQGAEELLRKVRVGGGGGGGRWWWVGGCTVWKPILLWLTCSFSFSFSWELEPLTELVNCTYIHVGKFNNNHHI